MEPLQAYMSRIGAEQLNFKTWMVKTHVGNYYRERALIKVSSDGSITAPDEYAPTEAEATAITQWFRNNPAQWPRCINTNSLMGLPVTGEAARYVFRDQATGEIKFVQARVDKPEGKQYLPFTFWSDGVWRCMEPDGPLPFFTPEKPVSQRIMVHEGAKCAAFAEWLCRDPGPEARAARAVHPWARELADYEHWGMIGGALAAHRCDWEQLRARRPVEVVYFCDNDTPGVEALVSASRQYRGSLTGIQVHSQWPQSWDIADPIPDECWADGIYIGPALRDLRVPATWATEAFENDEGRRAYRITPEFAAEWHHVVQPEFFLHDEWPQRLLTPQEFNSLVAPFSDVVDTARLLMRRQESKGVEIRYIPALPPGRVLTEGGGTVINTHRGGTIRPVDGDESVWLNYVAHLLPVQREQEHLMRWVATLIAAPEVKMQYGLLLISEPQGVGKSTLGDKILAPILGRHNVSYPTEKNIVQSAFNGWAAHKRLAIIHEIYAGKSSRAYNETKSLITDEKIEINRKHVSEYTIDNWLHILACSNSMRALKLAEDDRRWFVPRVTESKRSGAYWSELNRWLNLGGLQIVCGWAHKWLKVHGPVARGEIAPPTATKSAVIDEGMSEAEQAVLALLEELNAKYNEEAEVVITDHAVIEYVVRTVYNGRRPEYIIKPLRVKKLARRAGWYVAEGRTAHSVYKVRGLPVTIFTRNGKLGELGALGIVERGVKPLDLNELGQVL